MAATPSPSLTEETRQGFQYLRVLAPLLAHLRPVGTARDRAGTRQLFYDPSASLLVLYFVHPVVTSWRGLQQTTTLAKGQERLGVHQTSLRTRREAAYVFDATLGHAVLTPLGAQLRPYLPLAALAALAQWPAVDGSRLPAVPRMAWALWPDDQPRAAKRPGALAVLCPGPVEVTVTAGNGAERAAWRRLVQPGGFYGVERGDVDQRLLQELPEVPCRFLCRVQDNAVDEVQEARALSPAAVQAGVVDEVDDAVLRRLGTAHPTRWLPPPFRVVQVATGKMRKDGTPAVLVLVTNWLDLEAEWIAVAQRYRWAVELFFRWVKGVLGCRHVLSQGSNGVRLQVYAAFIASLLMSLWVGRAPTKRTDERLCFYLSEGASEEEVVAHIDRLHLRGYPETKLGAKANLLES